MLNQDSDVVQASDPKLTNRRRPAALVLLMAMILAMLGVSAPANAQPLYAPDGEGSISGVVSDEDGTPITEGDVWLSSSDWHYFIRQAEIGPDGSYVFEDLPPGDYWVDVQTDSSHEPTCEVDNDGQWWSGGSSQSANVTVGEGEAVTGVDFLFPALDYVLSGHVVDLEGNPISDWTVEVVAVEGTGAVGYFYESTDADGRFATCVSSGDFRIHDQQHDDERSFESSPVTVSGADEHVEIILRSHGTIEGVVLTDGQPVEGAHVSVSEVSGVSFNYVGWAITDSEGRYSIGVRAGDEYRVLASASGFVTQVYNGWPPAQTFDAVAVQSEATVSDIDFDLRPAAGLGGYVSFDAEAAEPEIVEECHQSDEGEECYEWHDWSDAPSAWVTAYTWEGGDWTMWGRLSTSYAYQFLPDELPANESIVLGAEAVGYCPAYWENAQHVDDANVFSLEPGDDSTVWPNYADGYVLDLTTDCDEEDLITDDDVPGSAISVAVSPSQVQAGDSATVTVEGLEPGEDADFWFGLAGEELLVTAPVDDEGAAEVEVTIPSTAEFGDTVVTVVGQESGREGEAPVTVVSQHDDSYTVTVTADPGEVLAGGQTLVTAEGFLPGEDVALELPSGPAHLGVAAADGSGTAQSLVTVPEGTELGLHEIVAIGQDSEREGSAEISVFAIPVTEGEDGDDQADGGDQADGDDESGHGGDQTSDGEQAAGGGDQVADDGQSSEGDSDVTAPSPSDEEAAEASSEDSAEDQETKEDAGLAATGVHTAGYVLAALVLLLAGAGAVRSANRSTTALS